MKKVITILFSIHFLSIAAFSQTGSVGIGTTTPHSSAALDVQSTDKGMLVPRMTTTQRNAISNAATGLLVFDNTTRSFWFKGAGNWIELVDTANNTWEKNGNDIYTHNTGNVGIGKPDPSYKLDVNGTLRVNGSTDVNGWFTVDGNVGIGNVNPFYKLDVNGDARVSGDMNVKGSILVNNNKGLLYNAQSSGALKYFTFGGSFSFANFSGHTVSGPHQVNFPASANFATAPRVMVGNYTSIGGTAGHLFSIVPAIVSVSTTGFEVYFFNSSTATASMDFTMTFICIGF